MPAVFKQEEISVREELNALSNLPDVDPGYGVDIGGGETEWGDGSITGSNSNGSYTKWPNGDLECRRIIESSSFSTLLSGTSYLATVVHSATFIDNASVVTTAALDPDSNPARVGRVMGYAHVATSGNLNVAQDIGATSLIRAQVISKGTWK